MIDSFIEFISNKYNINNLIEYFSFDSTGLKYLNQIYRAIEKSYISYNKYKINLRNINNKNFDKKSLIHHSLFNSSFIDGKIRKKITEQMKYTYTVNLNILCKRFKIIYYSVREIDYIILNKYIEYVFVIIHTLLLFQNNQQENEDKDKTIHIFFLDEKKELPKNNTILDPLHINSGACDVHSQNIIIFRREEWTKLLIHELFHLLHLDFQLELSDKQIRELKNRFKVDSTYKIYETYCEIQATIIHISFISFSLCNQYSYDCREKELIKFDYIYYVKVLYIYEYLFSVFQYKKIQSYMKGEYKEKTNVFCYYILKTSLLVNINNFFNWIDINNINILQFNKEKINHFIELLYKSFVNMKEIKRSYFIKYTNYKIDNKLDNEINRTLRMTINDVF